VRPAGLQRLPALPRADTLATGGNPGLPQPVLPRTAVGAAVLSVLRRGGVMGPFDQYVSRLEGIRDELEQAGSFPPPDSDLLDRLNQTLAEMKATANQALADLKTQCEAQAAQMHQQAAQLRKEADALAAREAAPPSPSPPPFPWEDHQGIEDAQVKELIAGLLQSALPHPGPHG